MWVGDVTPGSSLLLQDQKRMGGGGERDRECEGKRDRERGGKEGERGGERDIQTGRSSIFALAIWLCPVLVGRGGNRIIDR